MVGAQWGDEGKGKIVDWLSARADAVVRFQGGHNAGHTLVVGGETYKLSLLPSGVLRPGALSAIGSGVVIDPWSLVDEIAGLRARGIEIGPHNLRVAETASLILPIHRDLDKFREARAGARKIGTTGRGIGPAYEDKVGRRALRVIDLSDPANLGEGVDRLLAHHEPLRAGLGAEPVNRNALIQSLVEVAPAILPYAAPVWAEIDEWQKAGRQILFEGAQGAMLDIDYGTYPFVTSSNAIAGQAAVGSGVGPNAIQRVLGIAKAYATRVGAGPFPTENTGELGELLGARGREFGTVTGRRRRCGWLDTVLLRQAVRVSGIGGIAFTKLDVLDSFEEIQLCVGYRLEGAEIDCMPALARAQIQVEPIYETLRGWNQPTAGLRDWEDLPSAAQAYIRRVEEQVDCPIVLVSTSPDRDDTILRADPFSDL